MKLISIVKQSIKCIQTETNVQIATYLIANDENKDKVCQKNEQIKEFLNIYKYAIRLTDPTDQEQRFNIDIQLLNEVTVKGLLILNDDFPDSAPIFKLSN